MQLVIFLAFLCCISSSLCLCVIFFDKSSPFNTSPFNTVLEPRHTNPKVRENTINLIHTFRNYLHYHIKCSKVWEFCFFICSYILCSNLSSICVCNKSQSPVKWQRICTFPILGSMLMKSWSQIIVGILSQYVILLSLTFIILFRELLNNF